MDATIGMSGEDENIFKIEMESKKERQQITKDTDAHNLERLKVRVDRFRIGQDLFRL